MQTVNWSELMDGSGDDFQPLPVGDYDVIVDACEADTTQTEKTMFKTKMKVTQGPHAGRFIWNNFVISPESPPALGFFFRHMAILGLDRSYFEQQPTPEHVAAAMVGRPCRVGIEHKPYQGEIRMDVKRIMPPSPMSGPQPQPQPQGQPAPAPAPAPAPQPQQAAPQPAAPAPAPAPAPAQPAPQQPAAPAQAPAPAPAPAPQAPEPQAPPVQQPPQAPQAPQPASTPPTTEPAPEAPPQVAPAPPPAPQQQPAQQQAPQPPPPPSF